MRLTTLHWKVRLVLFAFALLFSGCECGTKTPSARSDGTATQPAQPQKPQQPLVKKVEIADWCPEHRVPESICTRCNATLIEGFKTKGDWCAKHGLPESQCLDCHPGLKAKFDAMKPKKG
ncbi:MAG: hypothetical protein L6R00_15235 [Phycisphaerae bacterium]|nr:hypothetical protein [Phycisphaerae bacterium]